MKEFVRILGSSLMELLAVILDLLRGMSGATALILLGLLISLAVFCAWQMQRMLIRKLRAKPDATVSIARIELWFSILGLIALPFMLIYWLFKAIWHLVTAPLRWLSTPSAAEGGAEEPVARPAILVATLGPSFFLASLAVAVLYLCGLAAEPLLRSQLGLTPGYPAWQFLVFGTRPELSWFIPIQRFPWLAGFLVGGFWLIVWWWCGRAVRLALAGALGRNLGSERIPGGALPLWPQWFGVADLVAPSASYRKWAGWLPLVAGLLLAWAWASLAGDPYRVDASLFAVALVVNLGWILSLTLRGYYEPEVVVTRQEDHDPVLAHGWEDVLETLCLERQLARPYPTAPPRRVEPLAFAERGAEGLISPLVGDLLPPPGKLSYMQHAVLTTTSRQAFIHTDPPARTGDLAMPAAGQGEVSRLGRPEERHQIVLAPEGAGKTTLALLAACNQVVVHATSALVVVRDERAADAWYQWARAILEPSLLRWNIRLRKVGDELVSDLSAGVHPDIVVCGLQQLTALVLEDNEFYGSTLQNTGLVIVDDIEEFCGAVELHGQLAFRRLSLRLRSLKGVRDLGEETAPQFLILGVDGVHGSPAWVKMLCGIEGQVRYFDEDVATTRRREAAELKATGTAAGQSKAVAEDPEDRLQEVKSGRHQLFYRLQDFRTVTAERVELVDLIQTCEKLAVPWHYRRAGDPWRHTGRRLLLLRQEPRHYVDDPEQACVVLIEGEWSAARRELRRLAHAGARFTRIKEQDKQPGPNEPSPVPEPIALLTVVDPDQDMALTQVDGKTDLARAIQTLPRPVVRAPSGRLALSHLASELMTNWTEIGDVINVFGEQMAPTLTLLAREGQLLLEARVDVGARSDQYDHVVFARILARAVKGEEQDASRLRMRGILPPRVRQVEHASERIAPLRDRTTMNTVGQVDEASSLHAYPRGHIFCNARGRFIVVSRAADEASQQARGGHRPATDAVDAILVEPLLDDDVSTPRRRSTVLLQPQVAEGPRARGPRPSPGAGEERSWSAVIGPDPLLLGRYPLQVTHGPSQVRTVEIATYRIGPIHCEVRQRLIFDLEPGAPVPEAVLDTEALFIHPNPDFEEFGEDAKDIPRLTLEQARLVASAMRSVLPSMYRGAENTLAVALMVHEPAPARDHLLGPGDAFVIYDLHDQGNGASRAVHRDGIELLLRLSRLVIERVLYHDRLRARFDHWGDRREIMLGQGVVDRGALRGVADASGEAPDFQSRYREADFQLRRDTLIWLDSRLRPEGLGTSISEVGKFGSGGEPGEGDYFDLGRCWYAPDEQVTDLLWTRHEWELAGGALAALDVGIDRKTAAESRFLTQESEVIAAHLQVLARHIENAAFDLPGEQRWGAGRPIWFFKGRGGPCAANDIAPFAEFAGFYHPFASAVGAHSWPATKPLADLLLLRAACGIEGTRDRYAVATYLSRFVQGIPYSVPAALRGGLRPPVNTLLYRLGDCDSKSLLLALLLKHIGLEAGLFVSVEEKHAIAAVAAPPPLEGDAAALTGDARAEAVAEYVRAWAEEVGLGQPPALWADMPTTPSRPIVERQVYIPVESTACMPVGEVHIADPKNWIFLPLTAIWIRLGVQETPLPSDAAEHEGMS
ncbi:MAG: DEAD/DEAH box helicase family protein [Pseudomonadota bacterium]